MMEKLAALTGLKDLVEKLPSEESMNNFLEALPRLEALAAGDMLDSISKLAPLAEEMSSGKIEKIIQLIPLLQNLPDNNTLVDLKNSMPPKELLADLVQELKKLPEREELTELLQALMQLREFLTALKEP